jgi:hypothetical protein
MQDSKAKDAAPNVFKEPTEIEASDFNVKNLYSKQNLMK